MQVSWDRVVQETPSALSSNVGAATAALSSVAWTPDGSGVAVMDSFGRLALLDIHGTAFPIQPAARLGRKPAQVAPAKPLPALAIKEAQSCFLALVHCNVQTSGCSGCSHLLSASKHQTLCCLGEMLQGPARRHQVLRFQHSTGHYACFS